MLYFLCLQKRSLAKHRFHNCESRALRLDRFDNSRAKGKPTKSANPRRGTTLAHHTVRVLPSVSLCSNVASLGSSRSCVLGRARLRPPPVSRSRATFNYQRCTTIARRIYTTLYLHYHSRYQYMNIFINVDIAISLRSAKIVISNLNERIQLDVSYIIL